MPITDITKTLPTVEWLEARYDLLERSEDDDIITIGEGSYYKWVRYNDGGGNDSVLLLINDGESALLYVYDHESEYNYYGEKDGYEKQNIFTNLPEQYCKILESGELSWSWEQEEKKVYATAAFWLDEDGIWTTTETYADASNTESEQYSIENGLEIFTTDDATVQEIIE